jgi:NitT/TauT family transport system substrate-binding protein
VDVKPGGPERDAIRELELGRADFGVASADQVIRALAKGSPVVVIAQLFQRDPLQWMFYKDRVAIGQLSDLAGKRLGVTFGKNDEMVMRTLLARAKISPDQVRLFSVRLDYTPFYKGEVDLWPVYINTEGIEIGGRLTRAGESIGFLDPGRYGVHFVANSIVTAQRTFTGKPALVKRFMRALLTGWQQSLDPQNAQRAVAAVRPFNKETTSEVLYEQLAATRDLIVPTSKTAIGAIDYPAWHQTEAIMLTYGQIARPVNVTRYLKPVKVTRQDRGL